jgi:hypothetical protein
VLFFTKEHTPPHFQFLLKIFHTRVFLPWTWDARRHWVRMRIQSVSQKITWECGGMCSHTLFRHRRDYIIFHFHRRHECVSRGGENAQPNFATLVAKIHKSPTTPRVTNGQSKGQRRDLRKSTTLRKTCSEGVVTKRCTNTNERSNKT